MSIFAIIRNRVNRYVQLAEIRCTGLCWERFNFLLSSLYGGVFWIWDWESVVNTGIFQLLQSRVYTVKVFISISVPPVSSVGLHKESWGDTVEAADPNHPTVIMLGKNSWGKEGGGGQFGQSAFLFPSSCYMWWSLFSWNGKIFPSLGKSKWISYFPVQLLLSPLNHLYLRSWVFSLLLFQFSPPSHWRGRKQVVVPCLAACQGWSHEMTVLPRGKATTMQSVFEFCFILILEFKQSK